MNVDLSVLIVNWNTRELLQQCLQSIIGCWQDATVEIIVVDNNSGDGSVEMVRATFPQVQLIANDSNVGFVLANNQAAKVATGKYLLLLNSDTRVLDGGVGDAIAYLDEHQDVGVMTTKVLNADGSFQRPFRRAPQFIGAYFRHTLRLVFGFNTPFHKNFRMENIGPESEIEVDWVTGACVFMRRELLQEGMVFDEDIFMYYEDTLLCYRVWEAGYRVMYVPMVPVIHYGGESANQVRAFAAFNSFQSSHTYFRKTRGKRKAGIYGFCVRKSWATFKLLFTVLALLPVEKIALKAAFFNELVDRDQGKLSN